MATTCLKLSSGFTVLVPSIVVAAGYVLSLTCVTFALRYLPLGLAYGIWGGLGTVGAVFIGVLLWGEPFSGLSVAGVILIGVGDRGC